MHTGLMFFLMLLVRLICASVNRRQLYLDHNYSLGFVRLPCLSRREGTSPDVRFLLWEYTLSFRRFQERKEVVITKFGTTAPFSPVKRFPVHLLDPFLPIFSPPKTSCAQSVFQDWLQGCDYKLFFSCVDDPKHTPPHPSVFGLLVVVFLSCFLLVV